MNPQQQIWLVRHGETAWSLSGQHTGREDLDLLPEAAPKLRVLQPHIQNHPFACVLSSPLRRAQQTARLIGFEQFELDDNLMEWDYGSYNGKTRAEIYKTVPDWRIWRDGVPQGETLVEVAKRARRVIARAKAVNGDVALVSHAHLLRVLGACWLGLPPENAEHFTLSTGSISVLTHEDSYPVFSQWNWQP